MKKLKALENIKVGDMAYKAGDFFSIEDEEVDRLINLKAVEFATDEIEDEENNIGKKKTKKVKEDE